MNSPPPIPQGPPDAPPVSPGPVRNARVTKPGDSLETYQTVADTVGMVPSLRVKDNVIQAVVIVACTALGAAIGLARADALGAAAGAAVGMIVSALISGMVLMVLGWLRAARRREN